MSRLLKCYGFCGNKYPKEELVQYANQNHCKSCADKKQKLEEERKTLYLTIQKIYNIPFPNGQMLRQIKQFKEDRNYTYEGMTKTLCYFVKVQKKQPFLNGGLSFLPYHYDSAVKYYDDLEEKRRNTKIVENNVRVVTIGPRRWDKQDELRRKRFINMGGLLSDK